MNADALVWEVRDDAAAADLAAVDDGLGSANLAAAPMAGVRALASFARGADGAVIGGAVGRTWGECCELQQFWVDPGHRRAGVGSRLVALFEARARERGCRTFYLDTFSFQAPSLYVRLGYRPVAEIAGFPGGIVKHLMVKRD